jgi:hypothetical protein
MHGHELTVYVLSNSRAGATGSSPPAHIAPVSPSTPKGSLKLPDLQSALTEVRLAFDLESDMLSWSDKITRLLVQANQPTVEEAEIVTRTSGENDAAADLRRPPPIIDDHRGLSQLALVILVSIALIAGLCASFGAFSFAALTKDDAFDPTPILRVFPDFQAFATHFPDFSEVHPCVLSYHFYCHILY